MSKPPLFTIGGPTAQDNDVNDLVQWLREQVELLRAALVRALDMLAYHGVHRSPQEVVETHEMGKLVGWTELDGEPCQRCGTGRWYVDPRTGSPVVCERCGGTGLEVTPSGDLRGDKQGNEP